MTPSDPSALPDPSPRAASWPRARLAATCFFLYVFYVDFGTQSDNEFIRYALTKSIVEEGTFRVDSHRRFIGSDYSLYGGHVYCDKPPGSSFLIIPQYLLAKAVVTPRLFRRDEKHDWTEMARVWVVISFSVALYAAISVLA